MQIPDACSLRCPAPGSPGWKLHARSFPGRLRLPAKSRDLSRLLVERPLPEKGGEREIVADVGEWLGILNEQCSITSNPNPAIDFVLDGIDELLRLRRYSKCEEVLRRADVDRLSVDAMLALLMETFRAKTVLSTREAFFQRVEKRLRDNAPDDSDELLTGLR